jgi:hypothetical protein
MVVNWPKGIHFGAEGHDYNEWLKGKLGELEP